MCRPTTFPGHCRMWRILRDLGRPAELMELADIGAMREWHAARILRYLHECGLIHVAGWRNVTVGGGYPAKLWAFGNADDVTRPKAENKTDVKRRSWHKRKKEWIEQYGKEVYQRIRTSSARGGPDQIVIDGKIIYRRRMK